MIEVLAVQHGHCKDASFSCMSIEVLTRIVVAAGHRKIIAVPHFAEKARSGILR